LHVIRVIEEQDINANGEVKMGLSELVNLDFSRYSKYLAAVASLTELFSDNDRPLIHSRTAERLFVFLTNAKDLSRKDNSFDARIDDAGVAIKTFTAHSLRSSSLQKIAEFSNSTDRNLLNGLAPKSLATQVARMRNHRLSSHALQNGISIGKSYYHCLVRIPGGIVIYEAPLSMIQVDKIKPIDSRGRVQSAWPKTVKQNASIMFSDGLHNYSFHKGKSVLMMKFDLHSGAKSRIIQVEPVPNVFNYILNTTLSSKLLRSDRSGLRIPPRRKSKASASSAGFVVLPLYSSRSGKVPLRSGLNLWLAKGRERLFGEAYIPVPVAVHALAPGFFPPQNSSFTLMLPNGQKLNVKICQQGGKALMSSPNSDLGVWLMSALDGGASAAKDRYVKRVAYTRDDLDKLGSDCLRISRTENPLVFSAVFAESGDFETFIESSEMDAAEAL